MVASRGVLRVDVPDLLQAAGRRAVGAGDPIPNPQFYILFPAYNIYI